jgi:hypothetical protein
VVAPLGATWTFRITDPDGTSYYATDTITQVSSTGDQERWDDPTASVYDVATYDTAGGRATMTEKVGYSKANNSVLYSFSYSPGFLLLPADLTPGTTASVTSLEANRLTGAVTPFAISLTVDGPDLVTVPAGTFEALKCTRVQDSSYYTVRWSAPGVGLVKMISYPGFDPSQLTTTELVSHQP